MCKKKARTNLLKGNEEKESLLWQEVAKPKEPMIGIFVFAPPQPASFSTCLLCSPVYHFPLFPSLLSCYLYLFI